MSSSQLIVPKGTRDFGPETMAKRQFIFGHIRTVFEKYGFQPLETPAMEQLSVLTGKYGDEGDQLLFKILNSGDYLKKTSAEDFQAGAGDLLPKISDKGLRYDLTVPFARYVVMHQNEITFPFKRFQMQPVWRADRPQKGRYREFYQCDADVVGTSSLLCEAEIVVMIHEVFSALGITDFSIKINHRKILAGISEAIEAPGRESELAVTLDKIHKIGFDKVQDELLSKGFARGSVDRLTPMTSLAGPWLDYRDAVSADLGATESGQQGINDLDTIYDLIQKLGLEKPNLQFDACLARGLSYYTGTIFEVVVNNADMGSVCGGGRYDDLTGVFGLPDISGVGISFGVDRVFDVMEQLGLFPQEKLLFTEVLLISLDKTCQEYGLGVLSRLRKAALACEIYPDFVKLKKALGYADKKGIPWVVLIGPDEMDSGKLTVKNMRDGSQAQYTESELRSLLQGHKEEKKV